MTELEKIQAEVAKIKTWIIGHLIITIAGVAVIAFLLGKI